MNIFYVFNPEEDKPRKIYNTYTEAYKDAVGVAGKYDEVTVYVLQAVAAVEKSLIIKEKRTEITGEVTEQQYQRIPF